MLTTLQKFSSEFAQSCGDLNSNNFCKKYPHKVYFCQIFLCFQSSCLRDCRYGRINEMTLCIVSVTVFVYQKFFFVRNLGLSVYFIAEIFDQQHINKLFNGNFSKVKKFACMPMFKRLRYKIFKSVHKFLIQSNPKKVERKGFKIN